MVEKIGRDTLKKSNNTSNVSNERIPFPVWRKDGTLDEIVYFSPYEIQNVAKPMADVFNLMAYSASKEGQQKGIKVLLKEPRGYKVRIMSAGKTGGVGLEGIVIAVVEGQGIKTALISTPQGILNKSLSNIKAIE